MTTAKELLDIITLLLSDRVNNAIPHTGARSSRRRLHRERTGLTPLNQKRGRIVRNNDPPP